MDEASKISVIPATEKCVINSDGEQEKNPFDILSNLVKAEDTPWWRYLWKVFSVTGSLAGVPPNVIFSNEFTEELFGKDKELLIAWAQVGSGAVNFAINFNSFEEIPSVIQKIPDIVDKIHFDVEEKCGCKVSKAKVLLAVLTCLVINIGAFLSNYQFAVETSAKFTNKYYLNTIVLWSQLVAAVAQVSRATFNLALKKLLPEQQETAKIIKKRFLGELNNCLEENDRLKPEEIDALAEGKLKLGDSTALSCSLATLPVLVVLFYSGAFGISAYEAASALVGGTSIWQKGFAFFGAGASFIAKASLLSTSVINMTDIISRSCGEEIIPELSDSTVANIGGGIALFSSLVWNTPFGASWVVQEHLLKFLTDKIFIQMLVSGITGSVAALPINILDSFLLGKKAWNWAENKCCPETVTEYRLYIKGLMKALAEMLGDEVIRRLVGKKYYCLSDAMEEGVLLHQNDPTHQAVFKKMGAVLNDTFFEILEALKVLSGKSCFDRQALYREFAQLPPNALTRVIDDRDITEETGLLDPSHTDSSNGSPSKGSNSSGESTPKTQKLEFIPGLNPIIEDLEGIKVSSSGSNSPRK